MSEKSFKLYLSAFFHFKKDFYLIAPEGFENSFSACNHINKYTLRNVTNSYFDYEEEGKVDNSNSGKPNSNGKESSFGGNADSQKNPISCHPLEWYIEKPNGNSFYNTRYNRDSFTLNSVDIYQKGSYIAISYCFSPESASSFSDAVHQLAAFTRECTYKRSKTWLRKKTVTLLRDILSSNALSESDVESIYFENKDFCIGRFDESVFLEMDRDDNFKSVPDKVYKRLPFFIFLNIDALRDWKKESEESDKPSMINSFPGTAPDSNVCYELMEYKKCVGEKSISMRRLVPSDSIINDYLYRIAKGETTRNMSSEKAVQAEANLHTGIGYLELFQAQSGLVALRSYESDSVISNLIDGIMTKLDLIVRRRMLSSEYAEVVARSDKAELKKLENKAEGFRLSCLDFKIDIQDKCFSSDKVKRTEGEYLASTGTLDMIAHAEAFADTVLEILDKQYGNIKESEEERQKKLDGILNIIALVAFVSAIKDGSDLYLTMKQNLSESPLSPFNIAISILASFLMISLAGYVVFKYLEYRNPKKEYGKKVWLIVAGVGILFTLIMLAFSFFF